jgi:hypothetical protein
MELSNQLHVLAVLPAGKEPPVPNVCEAEPQSRTWLSAKEKNIFYSCRESNLGNVNILYSVGES